MSILVEQYAPVVLFVYNRPELTKRTLEKLAENTLASSSDIVIYSDAEKTGEDSANIQAVREIIASAKGFKSVKIIEQTENQGLAKSIITGVTDNIKQSGSVIVLEDDIETSPYFLEYMNKALQQYKGNKKVWHISGWNYAIETSGLKEAFFWRGMNCWGWATWEDRWQHFEKNPGQLVKEFDAKLIRYINLDGCYDFWDQVLANLDGRINTWAIFWYATIVANKGLCLNPSQSLAHNTGFDGSGVHCKENLRYHTEINHNPIENLPTEISVNKIAEDRIKSFYRAFKPSLTQRLQFKIRQLLRTR